MDLGVSDVLARCRAEGRAALIGYLPVGFPDVEGSIRAMVAMVENEIQFAVSNLLTNGCVST